MAMTDFTIIRRSMTSRLFSTITTIATVAVAVALMLVLLSMRDAGERAFSRGGGNMHMLISGDTDPMTAVLNGIFYARPPRRPLFWTQYETLRDSLPWQDPQHSGNAVDGFIIPIQQGDSFRGFPVLATTEDFFSRFTPVPGGEWRFREGRAFTADYEAVLGSSVARSTGLKLGDRITLMHGTPDSRAGAAGPPGEAPHEHAQFKYTIVGILRPTGTSHDRGVFTNLESAWIIHAHDRLEREEAANAAAGASAPHDEHDEKLPTAADLIPEDRKITGIYLRLVTAPGSNAPAILPQIFDRLRKDPSLTVSQPKQEIDRLFLIVGNINQILVAMAGVVMISSGIAIMLALYNSMEQRRRQIAILRVLGCSRPRIFGLVLTESAMLGLLGAGMGILIAAAGAFLVATVLRQRLGLVVDPALGVNWIVGVAAATVALAAAAGLVPAVMAYRTGVAKNLRPLG
jgi:putative ABC transport system permease protein